MVYIADLKSAAERLTGSSPVSRTKFCKCQQVKDTLRRYFEGQLSVEQRAGSVPVLEHNGMHWSSIPSDVPSPARACYTGEWLL